MFFHCKILPFVRNQSNPHHRFMQNETNPLYHETRLTMKNNLLAKPDKSKFVENRKSRFSQNQVKWICLVWIKLFVYTSPGVSQLWVVTRKSVKKEYNGQDQC